MSHPFQPFGAPHWSVISRCWHGLVAALLFVQLGCGAATDAGDTAGGTGTEDAADADAHVKETKDSGKETATDDVVQDVDDALDGQIDDGDATLTDTLPDGSDQEIADQEVALLDGSDDIDAAIQDVSDDAGDTGVKEEVSACEFSPTPLSGEPGAPCTTNDECDFGFCVDTPNGNLCTRSCTNTCCPGGWGCKNVALVGDPTYGCVPNLVHTCDPCTDDAQCHSPGDSTGLCLSYGDAGRFCGGTCPGGKDIECPNGFYCMKNAKGTAGSGNQCMKKNGTCECSIQAKALGLSTVCSSKNQYGTCKGGRQCQPSGLTSCDAKAPGAEVCNGLDDNCDGATDEPGASLCTIYWKDSDSDGYGNTPANGGDNQCLCKPLDLYSSISPTDCDDTNAQIKPSAAEICDGIDNDCNGKTDETCDLDKDGYCDAAAVIVGKTKACKYVGVDCDDGNIKIHPGQPEVCGNNIDDDCDGTTDQGIDGVGCTPYYEDGDKDGVGTFNSVCACAPTGVFTATVSGDCNDSNKNVFPNNKEICGNGIDDNCNGKQDEEGALNCVNFYKDADGDTYGAGKPACLCGPNTTYTSNKGTDCNDSDAKMNPGVAEICNGIDDDCDGTTDNNNALGCSQFYADFDGDGFGDSNKGLCLCGPIDKWTATKGGDCDDSKAKVNPLATETCDGLDNDCNSIIDDPGATGCVMAFKDADNDGFGDTSTQACVCGLAMPYNTFKGGDCDDKLSLVNPDAQEKCNGIDDNCNQIVDEENANGCTVYYSDSDFDGVGNTAKSKCLCAKTGAYSTTKSGDCNDSDPAIKPGATEICDSKDNDCDLIIDNPGATGCTVYYADQDNDAYGDMSSATKCLCTASGAWKVLVGYDCNDLSATIHPGVAEKCDNIDNDCDGVVDPVGSTGCLNYFPDMDNDGYGDMNATTYACQCGPAYPNTSLAPYAKDCNDKNALISPGAFEICGDGIDNNCNGLTDEPTTNTLFFVDADGDGYGTGAGQLLCKPGTVGGQYFSASQAGDCNDAIKTVHPNAPEQCNGLDDDCNGKIDDQVATVMCGDAANATQACTDGKCAPQCYATWFNADGIASNGCECKADNNYGVIGGAPGSPVELGTIYDDGVQTIQSAGNIMPGENGDWYRVTAVDSGDASGSCDPFNLHVWFDTGGNPDGNFTIDLYKHDYSGTSLLCSNVSDTGWTVSMASRPAPYGPQIGKGTKGGDALSPGYQPSPTPEQAGECNCVNGVGLPGMNQCTDNTDVFYIRVGRYPGSGTICQSYLLSITNGK